jgi:hypothetical protein
MGRIVRIGTRHSISACDLRGNGLRSIDGQPCAEWSICAYLSYPAGHPVRRKIFGM